MCDDAADLVRMVQLDGAHGGRGAGRLHGVGLGEEALGRVVEEAAYYRSTLDEPGRVLVWGHPLALVVKTRKGETGKKEKKRVGEEKVERGKRHTTHSETQTFSSSAPDTDTQKDASSSDKSYSNNHKAS